MGLSVSHRLWSFHSLEERRLRGKRKDSTRVCLPAFKATVDLVQGMLLSLPNIERLGGIGGGVIEEGEEAFHGIHS